MEESAEKFSESVRNQGLTQTALGVFLLIAAIITAVILLGRVL